MLHNKQQKCDVRGSETKAYTLCQYTGTFKEALKSVTQFALCKSKRKCVNFSSEVSTIFVSHVKNVSDLSKIPNTCTTLCALDHLKLLQLLHVDAYTPLQQPNKYNTVDVGGSLQ